MGIGNIIKKAIGIAAPIVGGMYGGPWGAAAGSALGGALNKKKKVKTADGTVVGYEGDDVSSVSPTLPPWLEQDYKDYLERAKDVTSQPFTPYEGDRVPNLSDKTLEGIDLISERAGGSPGMKSAQDMAGRFTSGGFLNNPNLRMDNPYINLENPFNRMDNPFLDENSGYTQSVIRDAGDTMARTFAQGTAAQTDALSNMSGAYGGSGHILAQTRNAENLARETGKMTNLYNLDRTKLGATDYRGATRDAMADYRIGSNKAIDDYRTAATDAATDWRTGSRDMLSAGELTGRLDNQGLLAEQALVNAGGRIDLNNQSQADADYAEFLRQQDDPYMKLDVYGRAVKPNQYGQVSTTPGEDPWATAIGGGLLGLSMYDKNGKKTGGGSSSGGSSSGNLRDTAYDMGMGSPYDRYFNDNPGLAWSYDK